MALGRSLFLTCAALFLSGALLQAGELPDCKLMLVLPHPDDEIMVRASLARFIENGCTVDSVYLTQGEGGQSRRWKISKNVPASTALKKAELASVRRKEMTDAAKAYGFEEYLQLSHPDVPLRDPVSGKPTTNLDQFLEAGIWDTAAIRNEISEAAARIEPRVMLTFFPGQEGTHAHHQATARIIRELFEEGKLGPRVDSVIGFYEPQFLKSMPDNSFRFSAAIRSKAAGPNRGLTYGEIGTRGALKHQSQLSGETGAMIRDWKRYPDETFRLVSGKPDSFVKAFGKVAGLKKPCSWILKEQLRVPLSELIRAQEQP